jgi:hypothetical protein
MQGRGNVQALNAFEHFEEWRFGRDFEAANKVRLLCLPMPQDP